MLNSQQMDPADEHVVLKNALLGLTCPVDGTVKARGRFFCQTCEMCLLPEQRKALDAHDMQAYTAAVNTLLGVPQ